MPNIAPYIPKYIRVLHANEENVPIPYRHTQFGIVLMVDIAGFSTLMTLATEKGESGAEAIALEVGAYMGECIRIIEFYGGDVVKFLGDAVLVCFQPNINRKHSPDVTPLLSPEAHEISSRKKSTLLRRAVECGLQLLARLSHYQVYLTAEERSKHRNASGEIRRGSMDGNDTGPRYNIFDIRNEYERQSQLHPLRKQQQQQQQQDNGNDSDNDSIQGNQKYNIRERLKKWNSQDGKKKTRHRFLQRLEEDESLSWSFSRWGLNRFFKRNKGKRQRRNSEGSVSTRDLRTIDLELHIALGCGDITNIIIGEVDPGDTELNCSKSYRYSPRAKHEAASPCGSDHYAQYHGRLEYAIGGPVVASLDEALSVAKAGEMCITQEAYERLRILSMDFLSYEKRDGYYIIKDRDPGADHGGGAQKNASWLRGASSHQEHPNANYLQDKPGLMRKASQLSIEPLIPRTRNTSYMQLSAEANPFYYKYVNRSAVYRISRTVDGNFQSQFRDITVMFVSLGQVDIVSDEGLQAVQDAMLACTRSIVRYEGVLQQFAIDDKGATILCVFGLPPYSHEREAIFAAKSAIDIRDQLQKIDLLPEFAISLATGIIFNAVVPQGNPFRRDPGIAGDAIILAVRMLKFPFSKRHVICDEATRQQIGGLCEFDDLGENYVKGKVKPIQIYGIQKFGLWAGKSKRYSVRPTNIDFVGYKLQMERATTFVNDWCEVHNHHLLIVSGSSGAGKTYFCQNLQGSIMSDGLTVCWASCTEGVIVSSSTPEPEASTIKPKSRQSMAYDPENTMLVDERNEVSSICSNQILRRAQSYKQKNPLEPFKFNQELTESNISYPIVYCLNKCGEGDTYLPLFKNIFPSMSNVDENQYTQRLDERTRDRVLRNLVVRMVKYVSDYMNLAFICDDIQWSDNASLECLKQIHVVCNNALLIIATRPLHNYRPTFIDDMQKSGSFEHIVLNGLNSGEIGDVVLQSFPDSVQKVSPSIIRPIQERTNGNPLYVKNVAILLKDFNHVTVLNGQLVPNSNRFELQDLLGDFNFKRIIKMQYDRLGASFQEFITVASCLDQYFSVFEVRAVIRPENEIFHNHDLDQIRNEIHRRDSYNFLKSGYYGNPIENTSDLYSFSHIAIPNCIYDMVSFEIRNDIHQQLARYYEGKLNRENYAQLLGKVTRHYLQTDRLEKQLYYLECLARLDMRSFLLPNAAGYLKQIVVILENNRDLASQYGLVHQSDIYRKLGICLTMRSEFIDGEKYLLKSLECLGFPWPSNNFQYFRRFWLLRFSQWRYRHKLHICFYFQKNRSEVKQELSRRIIEAMVQLCHIYYIRGIGDRFIFTCLIGLNQCERAGDQGSRYAYFLGRAATVNWINDNKSAAFYYMTHALALMGERPDPGTLNTCAILCFSAGKFENAHDILYQAIKATQTLGVVTDFQEFYRAVRVVMTIRIFQGRLDSSPDDQALLKQMADTVHFNGDCQAEIWLAIYNVANSLVMCRFREAYPFVLLLEAQLREVTDYLRVAIHGTLVYYYARSKKRRRAFEHTAYFFRYLPTLTKTVNILPVYGLIFGAMAFYYMAELGEKNYYEAVNEDYDLYIDGVNNLNQAFQKVKFWEFMQPCLHLARALPYISTDRTMEGYMILSHGLDEMHYMQEINFLRGFYYSILGKYAFRAEERIDWTNQAKDELTRLGIPYSEYCNPDPTLPARTAMMRDLPF